MEADLVTEVVDAERQAFGISAEALREVRLAAGLTQGRLAEVSGVDASTISGAESGRRRKVRALTLARLAEALDVAPGELLVPKSEEEGDER